MKASRRPPAKAGMYNLLIAVIIAVIIVLAMNLVGSCLFPPGDFSGAVSHAPV